MKSFLKKLPGRRWLRGGWPDEARLIVQRPVFEPLLQGCNVRGSCLNAGCGEGLFVPFLDSFPGLTRIVHMDVNKPELSRFELDWRHEIVEGSLVDLPFGNEEFDLVFCTEVLEHIVDDARAFREIGRVLRPGGFALLSTPTPPAPRDPAHVRKGYDLTDLCRGLATGGMELLKHQRCCHGAMRLLLTIWRWQFDLGEKRKSWMPRALVLLFAHCDRWLPIGQPFDLAVLGRRLSKE